MRPITFLLVLLFALLFGRVNANVTFTIAPASVNAAVGQTETFTVVVNGFVDIATFQFALDFDETKLQFLNGTAVPFSANNKDTVEYLVNPQNPAPGANRWVAVTYIDLTSTGRTLSNGTTILTLRFTRIAAGATSLTFNASLNPAPVVGGPTGDPWTNVSVTPQVYTASSTPPTPPSQLRLKVENDSATVGSTVCVDMRVFGFSNMIVATTGIVYDTTRLTFQSIDLGSNPMDLTVGVDVAHSLTKTINLSWAAPFVGQNQVPLTLPDSTKVFDMCFTVKSNATGTAPVNFRVPDPNSTFAHDFQNASAPITNYTLQNGSVKVISSGPPPPSTNLRFKVEQDSAAVGATVCVDLRAFAFTNMTVVTTGLIYDTTRLTFQSFDLGTNPMNLTVGVDVAHSPAKIINLGWAAPFSGTVQVPLTLPDSTKLFDMCFTVKSTAAVGAIAPIQFRPLDPNSTFAHDFANTTGPITNYTLTNGSVRVIGQAANPCSNTPIISSGAVVQNNVSCFGGNNGSITVSTTGGTAPVTVTWTGPGAYTATGNSIQNLVAGVYTPRVTDANGCSSTGVAGSGITITQPATAVDVVLNNTQNVRCNGGADGAINVTTTGGTPGYTYIWRRGGTQVGSTEDLINITVGNYDLTVTDSRGCTDWISGITVTQPQQMNVTDAAIPAKCPGASDGFLTVSPSGGVPPYSYNWNPNVGSTNQLVNIPAGQYRVTLTDANQCTRAFGPFIVAGPQPFSYGTPTVTPANCTTNVGAISINPTGGTGPINVVWMPGGLAGNTISNLAPNTYTPTFTDAQNCTATLPGITVSGTNPPVITNVVVSGISGSQPGSIMITVSGGTAPFSYNWSGPNGFTSNQQNITNLTVPGNYVLTLNDGAGCQITGIYNVTQGASASVSATTNSCGANGGSATIQTNGLVFPYIVTWPGGSMTASTNPFVVTGLSAGTYAFTITDASANPVTVNATATVGFLTPAVVAATVTNVTPDNVGGSIIVTPHPSAPGVYAYLWANGSTKDTLLNLDAGTYCVTITNTSSGCSSTACYQVQYPIAIQSQSSTNPSCGNLSNGSITLNFTGANGPIYRYVILNAAGDTVLNQLGAFTTVTATGLPVGTYTAYVLDETPTRHNFNPITLTAQSSLTATAVVTSDYQGFDVSSPTACNGSVTITPGQGVGPYMVNWSSGGAANQLTNSALCAGAYSATVTDAAGCSTTVSGILDAPNALVATASAQSSHNGFNVTCQGICNGIARVRAIGGIAPYTVMWSNGETGTIQDLTDQHDNFDLCAGNYSVTVTDAVGTTQISSVTLTEPGVLEFDFQRILPARFTSCDGIISANLLNAAGSVNYSWTISGNGGSGTGAKVENLCAGKIVTFLATDANGCTVTARDTMPYPSDGCLEMTPVITPGNADNKNDVFIITCIEATNDNRVEIFNRWGQLVFETTNYNNFSNNWQGLSARNQALPEGVYFVVVTYKNDVGETFVRKTYVNIIRS